MDLNTIWFVLVGVLFTAYAMLDGFDLGVGALHLFTTKDEDRRVFLNASGPVWDGNEVWLVTGGGALFAAFPIVYATAFSGFYLAFVLLLVALIFRAVAIEFRSKLPSPRWRQAWDLSFSVSSILCSLLIGVALGNIAWGIPLDSDHEFATTFLALLNPFALLIGVTTLALFMMHGSIYLAMKTEGNLRDNVRTWINRCIIFFIICYAFTTMATLLYLPSMTRVFKDFPLLFLLPLANVLAIDNIPREIQHNRDFNAFLSSCAAMTLMMSLFGLGMYPNMIRSQPSPENSLNIYNASSSHLTLQIILIIALIGVPLVLTYTACIYWIFRGKVRLDRLSY